MPSPRRRSPLADPHPRPRPSPSPFFSSPIGEAYSRYRNFVNICAIKLVSTAAICEGSPLGCCGDDSSRLVNCNSSAADDAFAANLPADFVIDWKAVVLNGDSWWNSGGALMLWSGGHGDAAGAALHEDCLK